MGALVGFEGKFEEAIYLLKIEISSLNLFINTCMELDKIQIQVNFM